MKAGDHSAFDTLYYYYEPRIRLFLYPFTGDDAVMLDTILQDVFIKFWLKREEMEGIALVEFYLQRMAKNRLLDLLRLRDIRERHEAIHAALQPQEGAVTEKQLLFKEYLAAANEAIALLAERRRIIFVLNVLEGFSLDEVAVHLGLSKEVVKKQLAKAKAAVRAHIAGKHMISPALLQLMIP